MGIGAVFTLARFSEAFLVLRAQQGGIAIALVPLVMVANAAPADLRGTAYGVFNLVSGIALLIASVTAGLLWDRFGAAYTFCAGAVFSDIALLGLVWQSRKKHPETPS